MKSKLDSQMFLSEKEYKLIKERNPEKLKIWIKKGYEICVIKLV